MPVVLRETTMHHSALLIRGEELWVFWIKLATERERILCSQIVLGADGQTP
jgi:hypothetical protein